MSSEYLIADLSNYIDFGDAFSLLNRCSHLLERDLGKSLVDHTNELSALVPIRNRVYHTRPLQFDDLANVIDISAYLASDRALHCNITAKTLIRLREEPSFVLGLVIPSYREEG